MSSRSSSIFNVRSGEWRLVLTFLVLLAINTMVYQISSVVATADFLGAAGAIRVPGLWIIDVVIILVFATAYSTIVDRVPRIWLLTGFYVTLAVIYLVLDLLSGYGVPDAVTAGILYILADLQLVIFPLAFWNLANDVYSMAEGRRLFPLIAAGSAIGSILGGAIAASSAAVFSEQGEHVSRLLALNALIFLAGMIVLQLSFRKQEIRARQSTEPSDLRETLKVGWDFFANLPFFRLLAIAMLLAGFAFTIIEYHFLATVRDTFQGNSNAITTFYGVYQMVMILTIWLVQWLISSRLLKRAELQNSFSPLPFTLLLAIGVAATSFAAVPALIGAAGGRFLGRVVQRGWDESVRKSAQALVPDERRGRVSTFIDSYFYSFATLITAALLLGLLQLGTSGVIAQQTVVIIYLAAAGIAAAGSFYATIRMRTVYAQSLLNWRLARSRRKSVLDDLDFDD